MDDIKTANHEVSTCPILPQVHECFRATTHPCPDVPATAYPHRLRYAQSRWLEKKPAQALLQLNHAFTVDLPDDSPLYLEHPWPYQADAPRRQLRVTRAWLCFHLMKAALPADTFPQDEYQIENESLTIPEPAELLEQLKTLNRNQEIAHLHGLLTALRGSPGLLG